MNNELEILKKLCQIIIDGRSDADTIRQLYREEERLQEAIAEGIYVYSSDYLIRQDICSHQDLLGRLADKLYRKVNTLQGINIRKATVVTLNLLDTLSRFFPEHFDN